MHAVAAPRAVVLRLRVLVVVTLAQGALGGTQYALGVPELLVALHVLGAAVITAAMAWLWRPPPSSHPRRTRCPTAPPPRSPARPDVHAVQVTAHGGPEVLVPADLADPEPGDGEALVEVAAAGVNYIDTYVRSGVYAGEPPFVPGFEGAGVVRAVGPGVTTVAAGDRVAWSNTRGSYATLACVRRPSSSASPTAPASTSPPLSCCRA